MVAKISNFLIVFFTKLFFIRDVKGIENIPHKGPYIVVANHASYFDHFMIITTLKIYKNQIAHFITKKEAFDSYLSRVWHLSMGAIPLNRGGTDASAYKAIIQKLKEGKIVCIYPEGTRSPTGKMYKGKQGAIRMAMNAGVPIVPIGMENTFDILPRKRLWPNFKKSTINIGRPIYLANTKNKLELNTYHGELMKTLQVLSKSHEGDLYPLPEDEELYKSEMLHAATEWNELGIRDYPSAKLTQKDYHKRALYICDELLKIQPDLSLAYFEKARSWGRLGINHKNMLFKIFYMYKARRNLKTSIELDQSFASSYYALGVWYNEMPKFLGGDLKKSLVYYKRACELSSEVFIKIGLAKILLELGEAEEAKTTLLELISDSPVMSNVDTRRKLEALALLMRIDPQYEVEERMMNNCLQSSVTG